MNGAHTDRPAATSDPLDIPYRAFEAVAGVAAHLGVAIRPMSLALEAALPIAQADEMRRRADLYAQRAANLRVRHTPRAEALLLADCIDTLADELRADADELDPDGGDA